MAVYWKLDGTTLYLRGDEQTGYTLYPSSGSYITGTSSTNRTVTSVVVENAISHSGSCIHMFAYCLNLTSLDLSNFDTSNVTSMKYMFHTCQNLTSLDLSNFDTSNVTTMMLMFASCRSLTSLDLSNFDTSNVIDMYQMFASCTNLFTLNVKNWDTSNVQNLSGTFQYCTSLANLDLSGWETNNVTHFSSESYESGGSSNGTFDYCTSLETLKIDNFVVNSNAYCYEMFYNCSALTTIECKNTFNCTTANSTAMFTGDTSLQGETAKGGIAYNSSKVTGAYAKINGGYFTYPKRTLTMSSASGNTGTGTYVGAGSYDVGTTVACSVTPTSADFSYLDKVEKTINSVTETITDTDTISSYSFNLVLNDNTTIISTLMLRPYNAVTATSATYTIEGTGSYYYLDDVTLIANLGGGLITLEGWYKDIGTAAETKLSEDNPYTFKMPNTALSLGIKTGTNPFDNVDYRQFCFQNSKGAVYKLTSKNSKIYLNNPQGFGLKKSIDTSRIGNILVVDNSEYELPSISGEIIFYNDTKQLVYEDYQKFVAFLSYEPITLWYKVPTQTEPSLSVNIYHTPIEVTNLDKSEIDSSIGVIKSSFSAEATHFWQMTEVDISSTSATVQLMNGSDFPIGGEFTFRKQDSSTFKNPIITFADSSGTVYGACAINSLDEQTFTEITLNTKDNEQELILKNGSTVIDNPFSYINFFYSDGTKEFPFPKLKKGYTTLSFTYDNAGSENKSYSASYEKEFLSV